jgi:hypothetical protein
VTVVPAGPEDGLRTSDGGRTLNVDDEESPVGLPVPVIVYCPGGALSTLNEPVRMPLEIEQVAEVTGPDSVQLVSLDENPEPDT